ncbi:GAF domain-containing protein, partial [bacterium]|nr:GAF domain-containing protein [bacterium]
LISASPFLDEVGKYVGSFAVFTDLTEMKKSEKALKESRKEQEIRNDIGEIFFTVSSSEMYGKVLRVILDSMNCKYGFLGYKNEADEIVCPTISIDGEDKCRSERRNIIFPHKSWKESIWARTILEKKSFYSNKPQILPKGHFLVRRILCSPIIFAGETIGIIALANKDGTFTASDRRSMDNIARHIAPFLSARLYKERQEKEHKKLDDALVRSRKELGIRNRIAEIFLTTFSSKMYSEVQEVVREALDSEYGSFGFLDDNDTLVFPSLSKDVRNKCGMPNINNMLPLEEIKHTLMGRTIFDKKPHVSNEPIPVPKGHVPIEKVLAVPIAYHDDVIGLLMVANKRENYNNEDRRLLKNLASHISPILHSRLQREKLEIKRQKAESDLADSEAKYRGMFEHMNDGVAAFRATDGGNFLFTDFNSAGEKIDKINRAEVIGKKITDVFPKIDKFGLLDVLRRVHRTGKAESLPDSFYQDNRFSGWREYFVYKLHTGEIVAVYRDRTEHKEAEEALIIKDSAIESSLNAIMLMDLDGKVTYANPACLNLVGYDQGEVLGRSIVDFLKPKERTISGLETLQQNGLWSGDLFVTRKDRQHIDIHVTANIVLDKDGKPICMMGSGIDTTKLKHLQTQLVRSERLAAVGQLAASIAHEINSPLQAISVILGTLSKKYKGDNALKTNIHLLSEAFKSIRNTVSNLLDLNRPGVEKNKSVNINRIIKNTLSLLHIFLMRKKIKVNLSLSHDIPDIMASPQQLGQVFVNLLNNSVEAMTDDAKSQGQLKRKTKEAWHISIRT